MSLLNNMKIGVKLTAVFGVLVVAFVGVSLFALDGMMSMERSANEIGVNWLPSVQLLGELSKNTKEIRVAVLQSVIATTEAEKVDVAERLKKLKENNRVIEASYEKVITSPKERELYEAFQSNWAAYQDVGDEMIRLAHSNQVAEATNLSFTKAKEVMGRATEILDKDIALNAQGAKEEVEHGQQVYAQAQRVTYMAIAVVLALVGGALIALIRGIAVPLKGIAVEIGRMSEGDYSQDIQGTDREDEIGVMARALNFNISKVREIVRQINNAAEAVSSAAGEISTGSTDLSQRTEEQASSLEETAASMEEITGTVKQTSQSAEDVAKISTRASEMANKGGDVVQRAVSAMSEIERSSKKVSDIIGVIDEIAFQTNLLALNAAVEAARAGDAGKGFAVVASEVRSLAGRSASASKEIKSLIMESGNQVQSGSALVNEAGKSLQEIVATNKQANDLVSSIAHAAKEQSTGIDEINTAITQMDEVTQQNAALVEESTAAATSMLEQAQELARLTKFFVLSDSETDRSSRSNIISMKESRSDVRQGLAAKSASMRITHPSQVKKANPASHSTVRTVSAGGSVSTDEKDWKEF